MPQTPDINNTPELNKAIAERFATLPKVVQDAINSADVEEHLRKLAETQKLHLDQWQLLENDVMLTLMGFQKVSELPAHLEKDLGVTPEVAASLAESVSQIVFAPIRSEMEQSLSHPTAVQAAVSDVEAVRAQELSNSTAQPTASTPTTEALPSPTAPAATPVAPATPPAPAPEEKAVRAQVAQTYAGTASHERKTIVGDPYREQL